MRKVVVVGSGISGIATAIRLRAKGFEVDVFEANAYPGGKLSSLQIGGFRFDAGPSLFTLPELVTELFGLFEEDASEFFKYSKCPTVCNYFWEDGTRLEMNSDLNESAKQLQKLFNIPENVIKKYLRSSKEKYELTAPIFIEKSLHKLSTYFSFKALIAAFSAGRFGIFESLNAWNTRKLVNPKLIQLFNRYATYNGSSPYKTPAIMSMIPHLEMGIGTFFPEGGMISITNSLVALAKRNGVRFHFNQNVEKIVVEDKRAKGVIVNNSRIDADVVVSNMDIFSTYRRLLNDQEAPEKILNQERSSSALIFYWGVEGKYESLGLHNILFSDNYKKEFEHIFEKKEAYQDPTIYINISSKFDLASAPEGCENWFVMVNMPSDSGQDWDSIIPLVKESVLKKIERVLGRDIRSKVIAEDILDPRKIESKTSSHQGALYGTASNSRYSAFLRHANFSSKIRDLFFVGGSVHPGGGIPLCLNSAKIVSNIIV